MKTDIKTVLTQWHFLYFHPVCWRWFEVFELILNDAQSETCCSKSYDLVSSRVKPSLSCVMFSSGVWRDVLSEIPVTALLLKTLVWVSLWHLGVLYCICFFLPTVQTGTNFLKKENGKNRRSVFVYTRVWATINNNK